LDQVDEGAGPGSVAEEEPLVSATSRSLASLGLFCLPPLFLLRCCLSALRLAIAPPVLVLALVPPLRDVVVAEVETPDSLSLAPLPETTAPSR